MRRFPLLATPALALALIAAPAAHAAFPGTNGDIAFTRISEGAQKVWAKAPGGAERQISNGAWREREPAYSPDGLRIAYVSHENGAFNTNGDIYVRNADGSGTPINLTDDNTGDDLDPSWSPDGTKVVFSSTRSSVIDLYVMAADGTGTAQRLTTDAGAETDPAWSPDGATIVFETARDGNADLWAIDADGTDQRNLTNTPTGVTSIDPSWSPDGSEIVFSR